MAEVVLEGVSKRFGATSAQVDAVKKLYDGPGEKIYPGRNSPADLARARAWWGADVFAPFEGDSASADVSGPVVSTVYDECLQADASLMGLEFGTLPDQEVLTRDVR